MKKRWIHTAYIVITMCQIIFVLTTVVNATVPDPSFNSTGTTGTINTATSNVLGIVQAVAIGIAVVMLVVLAVKYITAAPNEKADVKKSAAIYVLGAVLLFAASGILGIIQAFAGEIVGAGNSVTAP